MYSKRTLILAIVITFILTTIVWMFFGASLGEKENMVPPVDISEKNLKTTNKEKFPDVYGEINLDTVFVTFNEKTEQGIQAKYSSDTVDGVFKKYFLQDLETLKSPEIQSFKVQWLPSGTVPIFIEYKKGISLSTKEDAYKNLKSQLDQKWYTKFTNYSKSLSQASSDVSK